MVTSEYAFAMSSKSHPYSDCPKDKKALIKLYDESYHQLLAISATGEGGKMDTPQKEEAAKKYAFYAECLKKNTKIPSSSQSDIKPLLLSCDSKIDKSDNILTIDMKIKEKEAYGSLKCIEISIRNSEGKEYFRAMNNRMSHPAPIPPNAFGIYPVGEKERLSLRDVKSAGMEAAIPVKGRYGYLLLGCNTHWKNGVVTIHWQIVPEHWNCLDGNCSIYVKIITAKKDDATWQKCSTFAYPHHQASLGPSKVKPIICSKKDESNRFSPNKITLVTLFKQKRQGVLKCWTGDTAYEYEYQEIEREIVDMMKKTDHTITLEPGFYQIPYDNVGGEPPSGLYEESEVFEVLKGKDMVVNVAEISAKQRSRRCNV